MLFTRDIVLF